MGKGVFARPPDTSLVLVLDAIKVGGREGGVLCVLLAIACNVMHCCAKYCATVHCVVLICMTLHCIALIWSDLNHNCIARHCLCTLQKPSVAQHRLKTNLWIWNNWEAYFQERKFCRSDLNSLLALKTKILFRGRGEVIEDLGAGAKGSTKEKISNFQFSKSELRIENYRTNFGGGSRAARVLPPALLEVLWHRLSCLNVIIKDWCNVFILNE